MSQPSYTTLAVSAFAVGAAADVAFNAALADRKLQPGPWKGLQHFYTTIHPATAAVAAGVLFAGVTVASVALARRL